MQTVIPMVICLGWFPLAQASENFSEGGICNEALRIYATTDVHERGKLLLMMAVATAVVLGLTRNSWRR